MTISQDHHPPMKHCLYAHHIVQSQEKCDLKNSNSSSIISEFEMQILGLTQELLNQNLF